MSIRYKVMVELRKKTSQIALVYTFLTDEDFESAVISYKKSHTEKYGEELQVVEVDS